MSKHLKSANNDVGNFESVYASWMWMTCVRRQKNTERPKNIEKEYIRIIFACRIIVNKHMFQWMVEI